MARPLLLLLLFVLIALTGVSLWINQGAPRERAPQGEAVSSAPIGGAFTLTDASGKEVSEASFRGRLMLVFFGFTHCPDICPLALGTISEVQNALGADASQLVPVFITVDPARDTPARMAEYLASFHSSVVGLTGSKEAVEAAVKAYKAYAGPVPESPVKTAENHAEHAGHAQPAPYAVAHSGLIYLMGRNGEYIQHFSHDVPAQTLLSAVKPLLK